MLMLTMLLFIASTVLLEAPDLDPRFRDIETSIHAEKWKKADKQLRRLVEDVIRDGGQMDGDHLMRGVRLRALIEAGRGREESAAWWWHAGLNLRSEGADKVLDLVTAELAAGLRNMQVRPSRPPEPVQMPKITNPRTGGAVSSVYSLASRNFSGIVKFELELGPRGELGRPLLVEATVPTAGIYAALDKLDGERMPMEARRFMGDTCHVSTRFLGR